MVPIYGHDYVALASNIVANSMGAMNGEKMTTSDVLAILSTPNYPGQTEAYIPHHAGGKVELMSDTIDSIELRFTDEKGNPLLSLENFIVTLTIDECIPGEIPAEEHVRLDHVRDAHMEHLRKKLRTHLMR